MRNIHLTPRVQDFAEREVATGAYADVSEGVRKLMEERGTAAFCALKAELEEQVRRSEAGLVKPFDPWAFEPRAFK